MLTTHVVLLIGGLFAGLGVFFYLSAVFTTMDRPLVSRIRKRLGVVFGLVGTLLIGLYFLTQQ